MADPTTLDAAVGVAGGVDPVVDASRAEPLASKEEYDEVLALTRQAAEAYYRGDDVLMDDATYDALAARLMASEALHPEWTSEFSPSVAVAAGTAGGDVAHSVPMLSLDNVFDEDGLRAWAARLERTLGRPVGAFTVETKIDGLALSALYEDGRLVRLVTRGDGRTGEDVTFAAKLVKGLPAQLKRPLSLELRGEVFMSDEDFEGANEIRLAQGEPMFANPRNGAAGSLRAKDRTYEVPLSFFAYALHPLQGGSLPAEAEVSHSGAMDFLSGLGVATTAHPWWSYLLTAMNGSAPDVLPGKMPVLSSVDQVVAAVSAIGESRAKLGFATDGAVVKADLAADRDEAGSSSRAPRWGIAYKFPADSRTTTLTGIELQVGRTGVVTPRAVLAPVQVGGVTITSATLHNPDEVARKDVRVGDVVWVRRAGEVIPEVVSVKLDERPDGVEPWVPPTKCPRCGGDLDKSEKRWRCVRGRACGAAEAIRYFASRDAMDVEGLGDKLVDSLVANGLVADVADLYSLTQDQLASLDRMGETSAKKVLEQLEKSKSQPLSRVFTGLGVRMTGRSMSRRLARHFGTMEALRAASVEEMQRVEGVGPERAASIVAELVDLAPVVDKLLAAGVSTSEPGSPALTGGGSAPSGPLPLQREDGSPKTVVVTGAVPGLSRNEAKEAVVALGGKDSGSVSKKTDLVVVGEGAGSKEQKARDLGLDIMSAEDFAKLYAEHSA